MYNKKCIVCKTPFICERPAKRHCSDICKKETRKGVNKKYYKKIHKDGTK